MLARSLQTNGKHIDFFINTDLIYGTLSPDLHRYSFFMSDLTSSWVLFSLSFRLERDSSSWKYVPSFNPAIFLFLFYQSMASSISPHPPEVGVGQSVNSDREVLLGGFSSGSNVQHIWTPE